MKTILFDLDGTIIDTEELHVKADDVVLARYGIFRNKDDIHEYLGKPLSTTIKRLYPDKADVADKMFDEKWDELFKFKDEFKLLQTAEFIKNHHSEFTFGLVTTTPKKFAIQLLELFDIKQYFKIFITLDDIKNPKPDPEPYELALKQLNITPEEAIVIEDSKAGIMSAQAAGIKCVGLVGSFPEAEISFADLVVKEITLESLKPLL